MYLQKKIYLVISLLIGGCSTNDVTGPVPDFSGTYKSITFIEPGPADGGVDIQKAGGYLQITFYKYCEFSVDLFIPTNSKSNYAAGHKYFKGNYTFKDSIVEFQTLYFIVKELIWNKNKFQLESPEVSPRGRPFKIILTKKAKPD